MHSLGSYTGSEFMMRADTLHPCDLTMEDREAWRTLCASSPAFSSPLLGPDFAIYVGRFRADALVTIWRTPTSNGAERPVAFLPHHRRLGGAAYPLGAPLGDYHGPVAIEGFDLGSALQVAGLAAYRFTSTIGLPPAADQREGFLIEVDGPAEVFLETLRQLRPKSFKNYRRLGHGLERTFGPLRVAPVTDKVVFDTLLDWKRQQLARTGAFDFLRPAWVNGLLQGLFDDGDPAFGGLLIGLYAGERLVAGHFGLRAGDIYHPWIASTDPDLADWAPGHVFLMHAIEAMPRLGLRTYDLGPGHEHYKRLYSLSSRSVTSGVHFAAGEAGTVMRTAEQAWVMAGAKGRGMVGRLHRRLEVISASEPTVLGRLQGYADTVAIAAMRTHSALGKTRSEPTSDLTSIARPDTRAG